MRLYVSTKTKKILVERGTYGIIVNETSRISAETFDVEREMLTLLKDHDPSLSKEYGIHFIKPAKSCHDVSFFLKKKK